MFNMKNALTFNKKIIENKTVLDLACNTGKSTQIIHSLDPKFVFALDAREDNVLQAQNSINANNVEFFTKDVNDFEFLDTLVKQSNTVVCFGLLYHLFDHFRFLSHIMTENIEYVLIETVYGPESLNPEMFWSFESTNISTNGWFKKFSMVPHGTPNLSWILQSSEILGFKCDWLQYHGVFKPKEYQNITCEEYFNLAGPDWPSFADIVSDKGVPEFVKNEISQFLVDYTERRMVMRLYNTKLINSTPLQLQQIFQFSLQENVVPPEGIEPPSPRS